MWAIRINASARRHPHLHDAFKRLLFCHRLHIETCRLEQAAGSGCADGDDAGGSQGGGLEMETREVRLALRCKNLLAANWRAQLNTLTPKQVVKKKEKVAKKITGTLVNYIFVNGTAVVFLPGDSPHCANLLINNRASLIIGHTDPIPLIKAFELLEKAPPRAVLVGALEFIENSEIMTVNGVLKALNEEIKAAKQISTGAGHAFKSLLEDSGYVLENRLQGFFTMLDYRDDDAFYVLDVSSSHFVDMMGQKHAVETGNAFFNCEPDPISPFLSAIIEGINQSNKRRLALMMFCAHYCRVQALDAYAISADRFGIDVLAKVLVDSKDTKGGVDKQDKNQDRTDEKPRKGNRQWKEVHVDFPGIANNVEEFCSMLLEMEKDCVSAFQKLQSKLSETSSRSR